MSKDFRSKQIRTIKLIGSSSTAGSIVAGRPDLSLLVYGDAGSSNYDGGLEGTLTSKLSSLGTDVWMAVSGSANNGTGGRAAGGTVAFLGDVVISGTLYSERMIVEVDSTVPGDFFVKNDTLISGSIALGPTTNEAGGVTGDLLIADKTPVQSYRDSGTPGNSGATLHGGVVTFKKLFPAAGKPGAGGGVVASITNGGDGAGGSGPQAVSRMPQDVWFHVSGAIGGRHFSGDGQKGTKRHRGVALFDGDLHSSGNLSLDGTFTFAGEVGNDIVLINNSPSVVNPESPSYFISSNAYTPITSSGRNAFMELATDQTSRAARNGPHWWVDLAHSGTMQDYGGIKFKVGDQAFGGVFNGIDATTGIPKFSHRHEMRLRADGNLVLQSDVNNDYSKIGSSGRKRGLIFSGSDVTGGKNHYARISYQPYGGGELQFDHLVSGSFNFKDGVLSASNGIQFPEGDATGANDRLANFGQQHGVMFQGSGAGRPEGGLFFNSATRTNPILSGDASTLILKLNSSQVADDIEINNVAGTGAAAIKLAADAGGVEIDAAADITLDAGSGLVSVTDGGVATFLIDSVSSADGVVLRTQVVDKDILFGDSVGEVFRVDATADSLLMKDANPIQFRDTGAAVHSSTAGQLDIDVTGKVDIVSTGTAADAVKIDASTGTGGVDIDAGTGGITITSGGGLDIDGTTIDIDGSAAVTIDGTSLSLDGTDTTNLTMSANTASTKTMTIAATNADGGNVSNIDIDADGTIDIDGASGINIGKAADVAIDIDASTLDIDASGNVTIDTTGQLSLDSALTTNLTLGANTGPDVVLSISATNAGVGDGNIDIDADGTIDIDGAGGINIGKAADVAIDIDSAALDIDAEGAVTIDATSGNGISLDAGAASNFSTTSGDITISSANGRVILSGSSLLDSILIDHDARFNGDVRMMGSLTVEGTFTKNHTVNASTKDPLLLLNSGSTTSNTGGGIAIASGSSVTNQALVFGRDTLHADTFLVGKMDVSDGTSTALTAADPLIVRASGYDLGTRYSSTPFVTSSNPTREPGSNNALTQAQRLTRMHVSMSNRSTNGDILMRMDGNLIVSSSNTVLKNGSKLWFNPTTNDGGPYWIGTNASDNKLELNVGAWTGGLRLKSTAGTTAKIYFDDDNKYIGESNSNALLINSEQAINIQATGNVDVDGAAITVDATSTLSLDSADTTNLTMAADAASTKTMTISATNADGGNVSNIDIDADGTVDVDGAGGINIGKAADVAIDIDSTTLDIDASGAVTINAGGASNLSTSAGLLTLQGKSGVKVYGGGGAASSVPISGSEVSFQAPVYFSENPAVGGPYYIATGSGAHWLPNKRLTFVAGRTGTFRFTAADAAGVSYNRAQVEFDSAAVFRNVSGSYFAIEAKSGLRLDANKNVGSGGPTGGVQLSGSAFSFQGGKKIFLNEAPASLCYIRQQGQHLEIRNTKPVRFIDANILEFGDEHSAVGVDATNMRVFVKANTSVGDDLFLSSSQTGGKITLQVSSSGAAIQLRGGGSGATAAGQSYISLGYVSGTVETKTVINKDANFILSGAVDGIHDSRVRYKAKPAQRGVALFMGDLLSSGAMHIEKNAIVSGTMVTKGNLLEFTNSTTKIEKDGSNNLKFTDANAGGITLTSLNSKVLGADQTFLISPGGPGNNYYTSVKSTGSFSFDYDPTNGSYTPRNTADIGTDVFFFVSGTVGGKANHRNTRTVSVFGGDMHISGTVTSTNTTFGGSLNVSYDTPEGGGTPAPGAGAVITVDSRPVQLRKDNNAYSSTTLLSVSGSSALHNLTITPGGAAADVKLTVTGSSGAMTFAANPGGGGQRDIFSITGGSGNIQIAAHASEGKLAFAQESATYIRLDNSSTPKNLQIYNTTSTGKITLKTGASAGAPGNVEIQGHILPTVDNSYNLGSATQRFANLYTGDLHLRNERGDWTIYEEPDMLVVVNNLTGKKYKMNLTPLEDKE